MAKRTRKEITNQGLGSWDTWDKAVEKGMKYFQTQALAHRKTVALLDWHICTSHISRLL